MFAPGPAVSRNQLWPLEPHGGRNNEFAVIAAISRASLFRAQSECLPVYRRRAGGNLLSEGRLEKQAATGVAKRKLGIRIRKRKHVMGGSQMAGACLCEHVPPDPLDPHIPPLFCPVCRLWPAVAARPLPEKRVFPNWGRKEVLTELRSFGRGKGWDGDACHGAHSFMRGCGSIDRAGRRAHRPTAPRRTVALFRARRRR